MTSNTKQKPTLETAAEDPKRIQRRAAWIRRLPLLPALIFTIILTQIPFLMNIWFSLTEWKITPPTPRTFNGIDNYVSLFSDTFFRSAVWTTTLMTVGGVGLSILFGLGIAMLLERP